MTTLERSFDDLKRRERIRDEQTTPKMRQIAEDLVSATRFVVEIETVNEMILAGQPDIANARGTLSDTNARPRLLTDYYMIGTDVDKANDLELCCLRYLKCRVMLQGGRWSAQSTTALAYRHLNHPVYRKTPQEVANV